MKVSIITASFNYADYIRETIQSVLNQTYNDWELIIVDDGSTDNSLNVISEYCQKDSRIKLFTHDNNQNKGLAETIKLGLSKAKCEYIAILESDDLWREDCLEKRIGVLGKFHEINFIYNDVEPFGDEGAVNITINYKNKYFPMVNNIHTPFNPLYSFYIVNLVPTLSSTFIKKEILEKCDMNSPIKPLLDWWLYFQISVKNDFYFIKEPLTKWRRHNKSYIRTFKSDASEKKEPDFHKELYIFVKRSNLPLRKKFVCKILSNILSNHRLRKIFESSLKKIISNNLLRNSYGNDS